MQQPDELGEHARSGGNYLAAEQIVAVSGKVADQSTGLGDQQAARGHVPGLQSGFEKSVVASRSDVGQIDGCRARAAQTDAALRHPLEHFHIRIEVVAFAEGKAGADQAVFQTHTAGHANAAAIEKGARAPGGGE
ncbi:hypothetical protein GALL_506370 [mine drainage metagenome]|uniref:Uncharacterized protein n=1 Tax=mine drainage metagenome TaxID=410659 RepID=A0A1J5PJ54_9ZZZZ